VRLTRKPTLADDIRASLLEAIDFARGKQTGAIVHKVTPRKTDAREARIKLGLSQREFASLIGTGVGTVRKWELGARRPSGAARADRSDQDRAEGGAPRTQGAATGGMPTTIDRVTFWTGDSLGWLRCELAFKTGCRGPFAYAIRCRPTGALPLPFGEREPTAAAARESPQSRMTTRPSSNAGIRPPPSRRSSWPAWARASAPSP